MGAIKPEGWEDGLTSFSACSMPFRKSTLREYSLMTSETGLLKGSKRKLTCHCRSIGEDFSAAHSPGLDFQGLQHVFQGTHILQGKGVCQPGQDPKDCLQEKGVGPRGAATRRGGGHGPGEGHMTITWHREGVACARRDEIRESNLGV